MKKALTTAGILAAMGFATTASAETTWNMATPYPEAEFHTQNINRFAEDVSEMTGGELNITIHSGQSLFKHPEIRRAVRTGQVAAGEIMMSNLANEDPMYSVDAIPFLIDGYDKAGALWDAQRPFVEERMADDGLVLLYAVPWPGQGFFTTKEINDISDMEGVRFRTYNSMTEEMATLMEATPTTVEAVEIPQAFSAGVVDAMVTSAATGHRTEAWEFSEYYYDLQAWLPKNMIFVSQDAFDALPEEQQKAVLDAAQEAETRGWEMSEAVFEESTADLGERMTILEPSDTLRQQLNEIGKTMASEWSEEVGPDGQTVLEAIE
ncbi:TRAP transporter substrate-binding protein [Billgrantia gudaonensis]|uniref:TRAP-type C4-dicarboxylate transport system, substrate-binding protein n=1 Tax=Billgrantia gudaonensis TaxID=376427 RepID=A0A1G9BVM5_9GAMM|nr:TRAP transporter substrate-binding protein [Halomonas gudaonensis]SDK43499.1 TRAP-type C4-dicarboxylate transport system, substrate-binding protein [Halomonas gudaonensis]